MIKVTIEDNHMVIRAPLPRNQADLKPSASGKSLVIASTRGNMTTEVKIGDKPVILGLNAYIKGN